MPTTLDIFLEDTSFHVFKTSISRKLANIVLHSRFPPFGFVLKPFWSVHMFLRELCRTLQGICLDTREDQVERYRRLLREEVRPSGAAVGRLFGSYVF